MIFVGIEFVGIGFVQQLLLFFAPQFPDEVGDAVDGDQHDAPEIVVRGVRARIFQRIVSPSETIAQHKFRYDIGTEEIDGLHDEIGHDRDEGDDKAFPERIFARTEDGFRIVGAESALSFARDRVFIRGDAALLAEYDVCTDDKDFAADNREQADGEIVRIGKRENGRAEYQLDDDGKRRARKHVRNFLKKGVPLLL